MSGHSKWAQIKHKKAATDAKRSQLFSKLSRNISIAARGGSDQKMNTALREAIQKAKSFNMPADNIERAIKKGAGENSTHLEEFLYEAYGPGGVAILIAGITDNSNRTSQEIKHLLGTKGAKWATPGSVSWAFDQSENRWSPKEYSRIALPPTDQDALTALLESLDDRDDVQEVYTNEKD